MNGTLVLFSSRIEYEAAFPDGDPEGLTTGICGVGLVDAGIGAARLIDRHDPSLLIFAGTCGAHRSSGLAIGDLVLACDVALGSGDVVRGAMRIPSLLPATLSIESVINDRLSEFLPEGHRLRHVRCSCTLGVTEEDTLADALAAYDGSEVENLELFSVLRAAGSRPAAALLGVTNMVGRDGGRDWRANFRPMMKRVGESLEECAKRGSNLFSSNVFPKESL